ncbi:MAG: N-acetyl-gamma-glutamyl-phosphate reductase [Clostridium sp.]|nr:N-acetyl-gamma-glutamyl-phosphate reductase [Clostridium sp.]
MIRAGIIGGAGYTAGELIRLLMNHPDVELTWIHSTSNAGRPVAEIHSGLAGETDLRFSETHPLDDADVVFLCAGHGFSRRFWLENEMPAGLRVVDLAQDFRDESEGYVYGLPEINRARTIGAMRVANPGCFATSIQLALLPLAAAGLLEGEVCITGITGSTGAGVKPSETTHFSWRSDNLSVYKPFVHQHLAEISMTLGGLQPGFRKEQLSFVPVRGGFARGIFTICNLPCRVREDTVRALYNEFYAGEPFTHHLSRPVDLKQVVNTNKALIQTELRDGRLMVVCAIDNLLKGASGQAVENMNIMFGLPEYTGLRLKPSAF